MADPFLAELRIVSFDFAPRGWALCQGQLLPINQNQPLFSLLGTTYGGNGQTTFALPDLRGRVALHEGTGPGLSPYELGVPGGVEQLVLSVNEIPEHTHRVMVGRYSGGSSLPSGNHLAPTTVQLGNIYGTTSNGVMHASSVSNFEGGSKAVENRQPFMALHYIIALEGIFPSPN